MDAESIQKRFEILEPFLDERLRRLVAASEARSIGYGGVSIVSRATGVSRRAITFRHPDLNKQELAAIGSLKSCVKSK